LITRPTKKTQANCGPRNHDKQFVCCASRVTLHCISMLAMAQLFLCQQAECHYDQATTSVCGEGRVEAEQKPICYGYEEDAQPVIC
jgi:hypothetical protein